MAFPVEKVRADTPGCDETVHFNNAGASPSPRPVVARQVAHLELEARIGGYGAAAAAADDGARVRSSVARLLGASDTDIALTTSDTTAWMKAFWGLAHTGWFDGGGRVLVDRTVYNSHYLSLLQLQQRHDIRVEAVAAADDGTIDLDDLDRRLDSPVRLVTATHVGTHRGLVNPVAEVGARSRAAGVPYFLDACQSTGQLPVAVEAIGCDVATGTGRKFLRGPRGTGFLYVRPEWAERMSPPGIDGTSALWLDAERFTLPAGAARFEEFEVAYAARLGLGVAVDYALDLGIDAIAARNNSLAERLRAGLTAAGATVHDGGRQRSAIVTFTVAGGPDPDAIKSALGAAGVTISVTEAPWARLDMESRGLPSAARASIHYFNTEAEVDRVVDLVAQLAGGETS